MSIAEKIRLNLGQTLVVLTLTGALAACGGSSDSSSGTSASSGSISSSSGSSGSGPSGGGSSGSGSSGSSGSGSGSGSGGGSSATVNVLFEQPQEGGIAGHLIVPLATHTPPATGVFQMVLWQPNPEVANGQLVPTTWDASSQTGFAPTGPLGSAQLGFQNKRGASTAQMYGDSVGAYLTSANLPGSPTDQKMMITPQFIFAAGNEPVPFASSGSSLGGAMDLQVPTATGSDTYVVADLLFKDPSGLRISFGVKIFSNGVTKPVVGSGYDQPSNSYMLNSPLGVDQTYVTQAAGSGTATGTPWLGWRHFEWSISQAQFVSALNYLAAQYPGQVQTNDPTQYVLAEVHLNAEFHFGPAPAELGWSMSGLKVWTTG